MLRGGGSSVEGGGWEAVLAGESSVEGGEAVLRGKRSSFQKIASYCLDS